MLADCRSGFPLRRITSYNVCYTKLLRKVSGFAISAFIGGVGGGLYAFTIGYIAPLSFGFMKSVDILVIACLGGLGSITGSILAAIVFTIFVITSYSIHYTKLYEKIKQEHRKNASQNS